MYYLKLTGPLITLSAQASGSTATSATTSSSTTIPTVTIASIVSSLNSTTTTTTSTVSKPTTTLVLKTSGSNQSKPSTVVATSAISKKGTQITSDALNSSANLKATSSSPTSTSAASSPTEEVAVVKLEPSGSPGGSGNVGVTGTAGGGNAAAARLIDLGKRLLQATREGQVEIVRKLIVDSGAPFTSDWLGTTALHLAAQNGFVEIAKILLDGGVNRDAKTKLDRTALHLAAQSGSIEIVDLLISNGVDVNARDMLKMTPLHWAVERNHVNVAERLLVAGSDLYLKNKFQLTPIDIAKNSGNYDVIRLFNNWTSAGGGGVICQPSASSTLDIGYKDDNITTRTTTSTATITTTATATTTDNIIDNINHNLIGQSSAINANLGQDLNQLFSFGSNGLEDYDSPLMTQVMTAASKTALNKINHQQVNLGTHNINKGNSDTTHAQLAPSESPDFLNIDHQLALIDYAHANQTTGGARETTASSEMVGYGIASCNTTDLPLSGSNGASPEDKSVDLAELEWNNFEFERFVPELFLPPNDNGEDGETNVEYLMKVVEELQKENKQLRQQVERLSTTSP